MFGKYKIKEKELLFLLFLLQALFTT